MIFNLQICKCADVQMIIKEIAEFKYADDKIRHANNCPQSLNLKNPTIKTGGFYSGILKY